MDMFIVYLSFLFILCSQSVAEANSTHMPRMIFTDEEVTMKRLVVPELTHVRVGDLENELKVTASDQKHLISFDFQRPQQPPVNRKILWDDGDNRGLSEMDDNFNITMIHKRKEANQFLVCGTSERETVCCNMNLTEQSPRCVPSVKMSDMKNSIKAFIIKEGEPSALVESQESEDIYVTNSGSQTYVGIHKFGKNRVGTVTHNREQYYVKMVVIRRKDDPSQDMVFAFYKEKNRDTDMYSDMWLPFVTRVCMSDIGGPKNTLQFSWTSQMNARLFCGNPDSKQHFSELIDVSVVEADDPQDTRIYALFSNAWGMSAVCVYTIRDINDVFTSSPFKGDSKRKDKRDRKCVADSTKILPETLMMIQGTSEMERWVEPDSDPLLFHHHGYTHIEVDGIQDQKNRQQPVLFLSLHNGAIHKVTKVKNRPFVIAEFRPFVKKQQIFSLVLHATSKKLYVNSGHELVQLDVANCAQYGDSCVDCVLSRDPYCGWNKKTKCSTETSDMYQDVSEGNYTNCPREDPKPVKAPRSSTGQLKEQDVGGVELHRGSKFFLRCPVSSHHAEYTWHHLNSSTSCSSKEQQCLLLIDGMSEKQVGTYECVSEEMGYSRVLGRYQLLLGNRAEGCSSSKTLVWLCLISFLLIHKYDGKLSLPVPSKQIHRQVQVIFISQLFSPSDTHTHTHTLLVTGEKHIPASTIQYIFILLYIGL